MKNKLLTVLLICLFQQLGNSQVDTTFQSLNDAKWSVGGGIGYDYSILGVKLSYHFKNNNFSVFGSGSLFPTTTIGAEYTFSSLSNKDIWYPYLNIGLNAIQNDPFLFVINVLNDDGTTQEAMVRQSNNDLGICASVGTHFNWKKSGYFSVAASCRYSVSRLNIEELNEQFKTNFEVPDKFLLRFTLAYNFIISNHS